MLMGILSVGPSRSHMCGPSASFSRMAEGSGSPQPVTVSPEPDDEAGKQKRPSQCTCADREQSVSTRQGRAPGYYCEKDLYIQVQTFAALLLGCFFYPDLNSTEAKLTLKSCSVGTFIVRNSSDPRYLYTVSVKTKRGPTSIRITYDKGNFSLDADEKSKNKMPKFPSLLDLIDFYVRLTSAQPSEQCRFVDRSGKKDLPIILNSPKLKSVPSLKHVSRVCINRSLPACRATDIPGAVESLPLPNRLKSYIKDYPYLH